MLTVQMVQVMVPMVQMVPMVPMVPIVPGVVARGLVGAGSAVWREACAGVARVTRGADHRGPRHIAPELATHSWRHRQARVNGSQVLLRAARVRGVRVVVSK